MQYDIVIFGNYTKDTIVSSTGTRMVDGGGFNYGAHVAAMMKLKTAAVTRLAREDERVVHALEAIGVEAFPTYTPHSTFMRLHYPTSNPDERVLTVTQTAGSFTPDQFEQIDGKYFIINASTRGEVGLDVIRAIKKKGGRIVVDAQGYVRTISADGTLQFDNWPGKEEILPHVDILKTDNVEAKALTGLDDKRAAAKIISQWGCQEIVLSHRDGLMVYANDRFYEAPWRYEKLVGRSGRGDTCIASYACKRLTADPAESTVWSAAVTSLKMEAEGPIKSTVADVEAMIRQKYVGMPTA